MAITNGYATLALFKTRYLAGDTDETRDTYIETIIEAVSREIDGWCDRRFYSTTSDETRYYTAACPGSVYPDDILTITSLKTDTDNDGIYDQAWASADYLLFPANATPKTWIEPSGRGSYLRFPTRRLAVEIVGTFGYCELVDVPKPISEACYLQSFRIFKRQDAPFGVLGGNEFGTPIIVNKLDGDVMDLIRPFRRVEAY